MEILFKIFFWVCSFALSAVFVTTIQGFIGGLLALICLFGGPSLGNYLWKAIEDYQYDKREEQIRQARHKKEQEEAFKKEIEEAIKKEHEYKMQNDWLYRSNYEAKERARQEQRIAERRRQEEERIRQAEAKRQAEITRRNRLKAKFHYINLGGYNAAYAYDYYPKNRYLEVDAEKEDHRRQIWNFKDGYSATFVKLFVDFLEGNFTIRSCVLFRHHLHIKIASDFTLFVKKSANYPQSRMALI